MMLLVLKHVHITYDTFNRHKYFFFHNFKMSNLGSYGNSASFEAFKLAMKKDAEKAQAESHPIVSELDQAMADVSDFLGSREPRAHQEALKILIQMMSKGYDISEFAPLVIQECVSNDPLTKQLAYIYLNHYADNALDSIVLSVNTFQKSLQDTDPLCRALALKTLSSIRSKEVLPVIKDSIQQVQGDTSPFVKKVAAYAIIKFAELTDDEREVEELLPVLERFLNDDDPIAFSGAIATYWSLCPDNIEFLHKRFRFMCNNIEKLDVWGQVYTLRALTVYARYCFKNPFKKEEIDDTNAAFLDDTNEQEQLQPDHILLISSAKKMLQSQNAAVVLAAVSLLYYTAPASHIPSVARPLVRLLYDSDITEEITLSIILTISETYPHIFIPHIYHFFVKHRESTQVKDFKLQILTNLTTNTNLDQILNELVYYAGNTDTHFAQASIKAIGKIAERENTVSQCMTSLLRLLGRTDGKILSEVVLAVSNILRKQKGSECEKTALKQLCRKFLQITEPNARAAILCIVAELHKSNPEFAPQLLRYIGKNYTSQPPEVRLVAMTLAAKVIAIGTDSQVPLYVIKLGERDSEFDVRDRARFFRVLVDKSPDTIKSKLEQFLYPQNKKEETKPAEEKPKEEEAPKEEGQEPETEQKEEKPAEEEEEKKETEEQEPENPSQTEYQIGTFSHIFQRELPGYEDLPDWAPESELPDEKVRWGISNGDEGEYEDDYEYEDGADGKHKKRTTNINDFFSDEDSTNQAEYEEEEEYAEEEEAAEEENNEKPKEASDEEEEGKEDGFFD